LLSPSNNLRTVIHYVPTFTKKQDRPKNPTAGYFKASRILQGFRASSNTREPPNVVTPTKPAKLPSSLFDHGGISANVHASKVESVARYARVLHVQN
jgi:hypothetical protein